MRKETNVTFESKGEVFQISTSSALEANQICRLEECSDQRKFPMKIAAKYLFVVTSGLLFWTSIDAASAQELTPAQIVKPADLTEKESAYYQQLTDVQVKKNFLETRSYARLCQQVVDHRLPAIQ